MIWYNGDDDKSSSMIFATTLLLGNSGDYFLLRVFRSGARCDSVLAATVRVGLLVRGLRSSEEATFATFGLVLR